MDNGRSSGKDRLTPDNLYAWTLALYPLAILVGFGFLLITHQEITTELVGLFIGLLTAGSLKVAIKGGNNREENGDGNYRRNSNNHLRDIGRDELGASDRGGADDSDHRFNVLVWLRRRGLCPTPIRLTSV